MQIQQFENGTVAALQAMPDGQVFRGFDGMLWMKTKDFGQPGLIVRLSDGHLDAVAPSDTFATVDAILEPL